MHQKSGIAMHHVFHLKNGLSESGFRETCQRWRLGPLKIPVASMRNLLQNFSGPSDLKADSTVQKKKRR